VEKGQLGIFSPRRIIFIWEGTIAILPDSRTIRLLEDIKRRMALWDAAVGYWEIQERTVALMWSLFQRTDMRLDVCLTTRGPNFALAVARWIERRNLPVRYVYSETPSDLGRMLPQMPDVDRVYYGVEEQRWSYGPRGYYLDPDQPITVS
jgi:hypothetical protein